MEPVTTKRKKGQAIESQSLLERGEGIATARIQYDLNSASGLNYIHSLGVAGFGLAKDCDGYLACNLLSTSQLRNSINR